MPPLEMTREEWEEQRASLCRRPFDHPSHTTWVWALDEFFLWTTRRRKRMLYPLFHNEPGEASDRDEIERLERARNFLLASWEAYVGYMLGECPYG